MPDDPRYYCVCNATYCDDVEPTGTVNPGSAVLFTTSKSGLRMERSTLSFRPASQDTGKSAHVLRTWSD